MLRKHQLLYYMPSYQVRVRFPLPKKVLIFNRHASPNKGPDWSSLQQQAQLTSVTRLPLHFISTTSEDGETSHDHRDKLWQTTVPFNISTTPAPFNMFVWIAVHLNRGTS